MHRHWTIDYLIQIIEASEIPQIELETKAKIAKHSIARWKYENRLPNMDKLDRVLAVLGYRISIVKI